jgi:hypothetical protein
MFLMFNFEMGQKNNVYEIRDLEEMMAANPVW